MADRVSASITIGGNIHPDLLADFGTIIENEGLSTEWDGETFTAAEIEDGKPLSLMAHEVPWGRFEELETFCNENGLAYTRWSGAYPGGWSAERVVFTGAGEPVGYTADDEDRILIDRARMDQLATIRALREHFDAADFVVPPLQISG